MQKKLKNVILKQASLKSMAPEIFEIFFPLEGC